MLTVESPKDLLNHVGADCGSSKWVHIDQDRINKFAEATGDFQWIHVDVERCKNEMEDGKTIAHGYLTLSLAPLLAAETLEIKNRVRGINYGSNKVRFTNMVPVGSNVRLNQKIKDVQEMKNGGYQLTTEISIEIEGQERPAMIAETISLHFG